MNVCYVLEGAGRVTEGDSDNGKQNEQDRNQAGQKRGTDDSAVLGCQRTADKQSDDDDRINDESD